MSSAVDTDRLCAGGFWIELGNAVNIGVIDGDGGASKKAFKDRAQLNESIHVEHGRNTKVPLFNKFEFVYYSAPGSRATASLSLTLARWCKLCAKLGSEIGWTSLDQRSRADFEEYTGVAANPDNIRLALSKGVLTTTETLRAILEKEQRERMEKEEIEKCTTCTKGCDHKRLPKAINMPYLDQIGGARRRGGGDCREDLRTVVSEGIPRQIVGGFQKVEEEAGEGEGQTPFSIRSQGEGERQVFFVEKGGKEVCGVEEEERVRAKCNQSPKLEGGLSYDRQEGSKAEGGEGDPSEAR